MTGTAVMGGARCASGCGCPVGHGRVFCQVCAAHVATATPLPSVAPTVAVPAGLPATEWLPRIDR